MVIVARQDGKLLEMEIKEWFLDVQWGKLTMWSSGDPSLPPVLLIHGLMDTSATFLPLVAAMPAIYHYVAFDLPGHGRSDSMPGPPISPLNLVEPMRQIVEQLQWKTFNCIAHSMGYLISVYYNAVYPGRIRRLVSIAGAVGLQIHGLVDSPREWFELCIESYYDRYCSTPPATFTFEEAVQTLAKARQIGEREAAILASRCLESVDGRFKFTWDTKAKKIFIPPISEDILYPILSIPTPTVFLIPNEDQTPVVFMNYHKKILKKLARDFKLVSVPGGHNVHLTDPELIAMHSVKFLSKDVTSKL